MRNLFIKDNGIGNLDTFCLWLAITEIHLHDAARQTAVRSPAEEEAASKTTPPSRPSPQVLQQSDRERTREVPQVL